MFSKHFQQPKIKIWGSLDVDDVVVYKNCALFDPTRAMRPLHQKTCDAGTILSIVRLYNASCLSNGHAAACKA